MISNTLYRGAYIHRAFRVVSRYIYIDIYVRDDIKYTHTHIYIYIYNSLNVSETHCDSPWGASWLCHLLDAVYSTLPLASHIS